MTEAVKVMVRCRPMNRKQIQKDCKNVVIVNQKTHQIGLKKNSNNPTVKYFAYDYVFNVDSTQQQVYEQSAFDLVQNVLNGYNGTIFAYGQTGCGKTHTMLGVTTTLSTKKAQLISSSQGNTKQNLPVTVTSLRLQQQSMGIIPRAFNQIITVTNSQQHKKHLIQCTFIQIYNQQIHDLLGKDIKAKLTLQQTPEGLLMKDLSVHLAKNVADMEKYMEIGYKNRVIRETSMNKQSSRSHCIFTIRIQESQFDQNGVEKFKVGKLNLVDLAGSERQSKTNLKDQGIKQAAKINLSLSALGNVISALVDGKCQHVPYRDSKLTRILHDSLGGNTKTVMIATISPSDYNYQQTLSTLRYSSRAKFIQNKPIVNQDPKDALLRKYQQQIKRLKLILQGRLPYVNGNNTFYLENDKKEMNIFNRFPELKNQQNEAILNQMSQLHKQIDLHLRQEGQNDGQIKLDQQKKFIQHELQTTKKVLDEEKLQKENLKKQLMFLQQIVKKQINTGPQVVQELQKIAELKQKLKQQKQKQQKYKEQQKKRQEQLLNIQKNYKNLNQQVDSIKEKFQDLRVKYVQTNQQLKDAREAHQKQKQDILDALRIQQAQNNKIMQILSVLIPSQQIQKLFKKCDWFDDRKQWVVPKFLYSQKMGVVFPKPGQKIPNLISQKTVQKQLQTVNKQQRVNKLNNLIVQQSQKNKFKLRSSRSQKQVSFSQRKQLRDNSSNKPINLFQQHSKSNLKSSFKNSYYSQTTNVTNNISKQLSVRKQENKLMDKYKFSLKPIVKNKPVQVQQQKSGKVSLDLQQIKREIMNQMKQSKKNGISNLRRN